MLKSNHYGATIIPQEPKKLRKLDSVVKRPTGMNREVYALLYSDNKDRQASLHCLSGVSN